MISSIKPAADQTATKTPERKIVAEKTGNDATRENMKSEKLVIATEKSEKKRDANDKKPDRARSEAMLIVPMTTTAIEPARTVPNATVFIKNLRRSSRSIRRRIFLVRSKGAFIAITYEIKRGLGATASYPVMIFRSKRRPRRCADLDSLLGLALATTPTVSANLIVWIFAIQSMMVITSLASFYVNKFASDSIFEGKKDFNWEQPLTNLVWLTSIVSIVATFVASWLLLPGHETFPGMDNPNLWWVLAGIISCGTLAGPLIMEFTKIFVSTHSRHVREITTASSQGGASLNILSGFVAGNFCAFWMGLVIITLMATAYKFSQNPALLVLMPDQFKWAAPIFAFGLVAFGFLAMGPVIIAVDSFGPVTDNAQSIYELSRIEAVPNVRAEIEKDFGFKPDFENAKLELEKGDGAGNTFKATAKPVLIGTAVVGAPTMIFGIIILLQNIGLQNTPTSTLKPC